MYEYKHNFAYVFVSTPCAIKYADNNRKNCTKNKIHNPSYGVAAVSTSVQQIHAKVRLY